uniref:Uncharacterized protein n=1 Tax=Candidatus Berkiella cookevillensis TaxID=437022 RepID=A0A0Q9Y8R6_9GAMM
MPNNGSADVYKTIVFPSGVVISILSDTIFFEEPGLVKFKSKPPNPSGPALAPSAKILPVSVTEDCVLKADSN